MTVQPMAAVDTEKLHSLQSQRHYQVTVETKLANLIRLMDFCHSMRVAYSIE